jgi:hypothetical protein
MDGKGQAAMMLRFAQQARGGLLGGWQSCRNKLSKRYKNKQNDTVNKETTHASSERYF